MPSRTISIRGARTHNLKNVSVDIPQRQLTVITGPSGSGKSSLAFNTLYAEGQRRFVESMSTYVRQFLERIDRPDVDEIDGILPAIAIEQKNSVKNARSTVATATELADHIRLFMTYCGETWCPDCRRERAQGEPGVDHQRDPGDPRRQARGRPRAGVLRSQPSRDRGRAAGEGRLLPRLDRRRGRGHQRVDTKKFTSLEMVINRLRIEEERRTQITEAHRAGVRALEGERERARGIVKRAGSPTASLRTSPATSAGTEFIEPTPHMFSFNSPLGACTNCQGYGRIIGIDLEKVIPNRDLRLDELPGHAVELRRLRGLLRGPGKGRGQVRPAARRAGQGPHHRRVGAALQRPRQVVRHQGLLRVAGDEEVQDPRAREAGQVPQLRAVPAMPRLAPEGRRATT